MEKGKPAKKEQQEHKRKRNHENRSNAHDKQQVNSNPSRSKKAKKNKINEGEKTSKKRQSSSLPWFLFTLIIVTAVVIAFLYLVDYEKFTKVKLATNASLNKTLSLLPPELVSKGKDALEFIHPPVKAVLNQLSAAASKVSTFLNTNPVVRDHWVNAREISSVCGGLFVDYLRTLYLLTCWCCNKLLP